MIKNIIKSVLLVSVFLSVSTVSATVFQHDQVKIPNAAAHPVKKLKKRTVAPQKHRHRKQLHTKEKKKKTVKSNRPKNKHPQKNALTLKKEPKYQIGYNRIQGYHRISATPEQSSFVKKASFSSFFAFSLKDKLVKYVEKTVHGLNYTTYKLGGRKFDPEKGVYIIDCSIYVDNILQEVFPSGFESLTSSTDTVMPTSLHYYSFFKSLSDENQHWDKVENVSNLQAGDILVFRNKRYRRAHAGGHVMIVMNTPKKMGQSSYLVEVADSAPYRHSRDTRPAQHSGIGIGALLLRVNSKTGEPSAYAWSIGAKWKSNVHFAMARPVKS